MDKLKAERIIQAGLDRKADFVEIFEEETRNASVSFRDRKVESATAGTDYGLGIRLVYGTEVLYAHTSNDEEGHIIKLIDNLARSRGVVFRDTSEPTVNLVGKVFENRHKIVKDPREIGQERKLDLIKLADQAARAYSDKIVQVNSRAGDVVSHVLISNSEGLYVEDTRTRCRFTVNVTAESGGEIFVASEAPGTMRGFEFFESLDIARYARMAAERAVLMLSAGYVKGGKLPVIMGNGFGGAIFHEACGHLLETEAVRRKATPFAGKVGQAIAHSAVTAIDDGTIQNAWGSINVDDEGNPAQKTVLIKDGVLQSYMSDRVGAKETGSGITGSSRRESYQYAPVSRMRNTYIDRGKHTVEEMIGGIDEGLYAKKMGGGSVNPATGEFNFAVEEAYRIRGGKIAEPVRGATLIGKGPDILPLISMVGDDLEMAAGMCGASSGSVPVMVGQPTIKVDNILVGGKMKEIRRDDHGKEPMPSSAPAAAGNARGGETLSPADALDYICAEAKRLGADRYDAVAGESESMGLELFEGKVKSTEISNSRGIGIRLFKGKRPGFAFTEKMGREAITQTVKDAISHTLLTDEVEMDLPFPEKLPDIDLKSFNPELEEVGLDRMKALGLELEALARELDPRIDNIPYLGASRSSGMSMVRNSNGVAYSSRSNVMSAGLGVVAKEGEAKKMGVYSNASRSLSFDPKFMARKAVERAVELLGAESVTSGRYPVVFSNRVSASIMSMFGSPYFAEAVQKGQSRLSGKLGQAIAVPELNITSNPHIPGMPGSHLFDGEGVVSQVLKVVEGGVLKTYLYNLESAKQEGVKPTGTGSRGYSGKAGTGFSNFIVDKGDKTLEQLLSAYPECLLITKLEGGSGCSAISGEISIGVQGFWYEQGKRIKPVDKVTLNSNYFELLLAIRGLSAEYSDAFSSVKVPDFLVESMYVAG